MGSNSGFLLQIKLENYLNSIPPDQCHVINLCNTYLYEYSKQASNKHMAYDKNNG